MSQSERAAEDGPTAAQPSGVSQPLMLPDPAAEAPELEAFETVGHYQVLKYLGGGGMAQVYAARSLLARGVDKLVAFKTAREGFGPKTQYGAMFLTEAKVSATLQHPNIVQVFDFGEAAGRPYLAMELVPGRDLLAVLRLLRATNKPAPPALVTAIGIALCRALEYVHEKHDLDGKPLNLVHRDVGPANVLLTTRSEVKLMDFGVAAAQTSEASASDLVVGKIAYMPPEQLRGQQPAPGWDLYPLGVTLYQLVTLHHPWRGKAAEYLLMDSLRFYRGAPSQLNPLVPEVLDEVLVKATQLEAAARFPTARALREALEVTQAVMAPADLGAWVKGLFGEALLRDEAEHEALMAEARRRTATRVPKVFQRVRDTVVYSAPYRRLARRPALLRAVTLGFVLLVLSSLGFGGWRWRERAALREGLQRADAQAMSGRLTSAGGGAALDLLLELEQRFPSDARVQQRLGALSARFEQLGTAALERRDLDEAAAHLEAALKAEPSRQSARRSLDAVEEAVRARSKGKVVQTQ